MGCFLIFVLNLGVGERGRRLKVPYPVGCSWRNLSFTGSGRAFVVWSGFQSHMLAFHLAMSALVWVFVLIVAILV
ncbi:MAG: hypothetical protein CM1200mP35_00710 [Chloroflexota bacterium]|nr:MAG: hypothetical protein CM1200mP35_00710 [Chloroflexota bacterium]